MTPIARRAIMALIGMGAGATTLAAVVIAPHEGLSLTAYRDSVGVWTVCRGHTATAKPGQSYTEAECEALFASDVGQYLGEVDAAIKPEIPAASMAAIASLCYNVGLGTCRPVIDRVNAGRLRDACEAISLYVYAGGRDCRKPGTNCAGIVTRRQDERALCLMGLQ